MKMSNYQHEAEHMAMSRLSWFALGLMAGAAVALLTAPMKGAESRQVLRRRVREAADNVSHNGAAFFDQQAHRMSEVIERGRTNAQSFGTRVNEAFEQGKKAYSSARDRVQANGADVAAKAGDAIDEMANRASS